MAISVNSVTSKYNSVTETNKTQKDYDFSSNIENTNYSSIDAFSNDIMALEKKYSVQYSNIISEDNVTTVDDLKQEISTLFPEYTMVSSQPSDVVQGKNLLYIDESNLQKMVDDPAYRAEVYALMRRELVGMNGFHVNGSAYKLTGTVFSLSNSNPCEGGIPYSGMCTGVMMDNSTVFNGSTNKVTQVSTSIKNTSEHTKTEKEENNNSKNEASDIYYTELMKNKKVIEQLKETAYQDVKEEVENIREAAIKKYEDGMLFSDN